MPAAATPMLQQYHRAKRENPGTILLFRLGDFYEMFFEDARIASGILGIALTARGKGTENEAPMCGIPYHAMEGYVAKLVAAGHRVALCDQVEEASKAKGLVKREVVRVLSPGTVTDPNSLDARSHLYLAALCRGQKNLGLAFADLSTGDLAVSEISSGREAEELALQFASFQPREILVPESENGLEDLLPAAPEGERRLKLTTAPGWLFGEDAAFDALTRQFETAGLDGFGCAGMTTGIRAAGALILHLRETQKCDLEHFTRIRPHQTADHLLLDETTLATLEVSSALRGGGRKGTLLEVLDRTITPMGARELRSWLHWPSLDLAEIRGRHDAVGELADKTIEREELREALSPIKDMERILGRLAIGTAGPRDLVSLRDSLAALPALAALRAGLASRLLKAEDDEDCLDDLDQLIRRSIADEPAADLKQGGVVRDGYSEELDELRAISRDGRSYIANLESREKKRTGIASLKVRHNKVFGYYIEISKANLALVPPDYDRRQTLVNAERFITPELKEYEEKVMTAQEKIGQIESGIFREIRDQVARESRRIRAASERVAGLDALSSLAETAAAEGYARPKMVDSGTLVIREGRHPVVERTSSEPFVPNGVTIGGEGPRVLIITGPNMGGKSTYLRQVAQITLLAHAGSFIPAVEATIPLVDRIFSRVGASDNLASGQSTFMVEMTETANILHNATSRSLVLLDEVGRGTATFDGLSLAWAIVEHLLSGKEPAPLTLFATHYHELTDLALTFPGVKNLTMAVEEGRSGVTFLRKVLEGTSDRSYGIHVAKLAGLPGGLIERAKEILFNLESNEVGRDGMPRLAKQHGGRIPEAQLNLFGGVSGPAEAVAGELEKLDPDDMTPLQALEVLARLKKMLRE